ncbi:FtsK/SpoIIIE domain-containing protein [Kitasatospora sp. NPDC057500]|uniref:FtsK/SpoIIIE domain-containing protein n=1 Tax=Kitasatospora sp. NPDC057500 TaxID=3346151 RepID=UPI00368DC069
MQIRLTVLRPRSGPAAAGSAIPYVDVLVTAPVGTALGSLAGALAGAVGVRGPRAATHVHLYSGAHRVDEHTLLGHPPLLDGAVLSLNEPDPTADDPDDAPASAELRVVGGPDAGGVHRLHGREIRVGRSGEADVPVDDPDVSRLHLALHLADDGTVTVRDLGSTNGTTVDGRIVPPGPPEEAVPLDGAGLVRIGETTLRIATPDPRDGSAAPARAALPDGHGHLQLAAPAPVRPAPPAAEPPAAPEPPAGRGRGLLSLRLGRSAAEPAEESAERHHAAARVRQAAAQRERWPDLATLLLNALGPGPRLWERGPGHPDALTLRLGTADRPGGPGTSPGTVLPAVPVTVDLQTAGSLGLSGPRERLDALVRAVVAQLAALHPPTGLSLVVVDADPARTPQDRADTWAWALWLPHLRPTDGQDCRLLLGLDDEQATARLTELTGRLSGPVGLGGHPATVVVVDGRPGTESARLALDLLLRQGPAVGIFPVCLAEQPELLPRGLGATALITGEVGTQLSIDRPSPTARGRETLHEVSLDAVSDAWAERLARVLAPLREAAPANRGPLPDALRLLDLLQLDTVTPAKLSARWTAHAGGIGAATALLGTTRDELCVLDLADPELALPSPDPGGPHLLIGGARGSGKTELLRTLVASLAVSERPERLAVTIVEGRATEDGLAGCSELPHVTGRVNAATDPRAALLAAEALEDELALRERLFDGLDFASWHAARILDGEPVPVPAAVGAPTAPAAARVIHPRSPDSPAAPVTAPPASGPCPPRLVVVVDDYDALLAPTSPVGRPLARALAAVARRGGPLGIHLAVTTGRPDETTGTDVDEAALLRIALRTEDPTDSDLLIHLGDAAALPDSTPGRGYLRLPDGGVTAFQAARISGRIPRTATLRPTVVAIDPHTLGAPPARRPVRELGNGPTDLALLASALQRAAAR